MQSDASSSALSLKFRHHKERAHRLKAIIFAVSIVLAYFTFTIYTHSGPIVLGTEMNGNGQVEYMCIGRSCEDLGANFSWKDQ